MSKEYEIIITHSADDAEWFACNPQRHYHLRPLLPQETATVMRANGAEVNHSWLIVRRDLECAAFTPVAIPRSTTTKRASVSSTALCGSPTVRSGVPTRVQRSDESPLPFRNTASERNLPAS